MFRKKRKIRVDANILRKPRIDAKLVKKRLIDFDMKQGELAKQVNISGSYLSDMLSGKCAGSKHINNIYKVLDIDIRV